MADATCPSLDPSGPSVSPDSNAALLARLLGEIETHDLNYQVRYVLVLQAAGVAAALGYPAGIRVDPLEPAWPVVFIQLPTGQVSWHVPAHTTPWDGHSTEQKYARIRAFAAGLGSPGHEHWGP